MITIICVCIVIALVGIDQLFKYLAVQYLIPGSTTTVIHFGNKEVFNLTYCENTGAAFSFMSGKQTLLIIITIIALILFSVYIYKSKHRNKLFVASYLMIVSGGIGNLIDRIWRGYVIDYIEFRLFEFAIFNFADICVVGGGILLIIYVILEEKKNAKEKSGASAEYGDKNE